MYRATKPSLRQGLHVAAAGCPLIQPSVMNVPNQQQLPLPPLWLIVAIAPSSSHQQPTPCRPPPLPRRFPVKVAPGDTPLSDPFAAQNVQPNSQMSAGRRRHVDNIDPSRVPLAGKESNPVSYEADSKTGGGSMGGA